MEPHCESCGRQSSLYCSRCKIVRYCSRDCQRASWPIHKIDCKTPEARANQAELASGMRALLAEYEDIDESKLATWTYDESEKGEAPSVGSGSVDEVERRKKSAAAALLGQFVPLPEGKEAGNIGGVSESRKGGQASGKETK